ncbi:MAG: hypothetical protein BWY76_02560 [bacterium ADurb.Bin429]|nr:MAG: hypothetical protein BWY76_02560 [bacterium ADurb.Bin429]
MAVALAGFHYRGGDTRGIRHAVATGDITRTDYHREVELVRPHVVAQHVQVGDFDAHFLPRLDIADGLREDIRPFLFQQAGGSSPAECFLVKLAGVRAFLDDAHDAAVADHHRHAVHCRCIRQRKDVDRFDLILGGVDECLHHLHPRDEAGNVTFHRRMLQRTFNHVAVRLPHAQCALGHVGVNGRRNGLGEKRAHREDQTEEQRNEPHGGTSCIRLCQSRSKPLRS